MAIPIPMTGGFSGFGGTVALNNAVMPSYAVAERNLFPKNGDSGLKVHAGRPIAQPQKNEGGATGGTGGATPTSNAEPISGSRKAQRRAKYAEALAEDLMKEGASTKPTIGSGWSPIVQGLSRAATGGLGGLIARRGERLQAEGEEQSARAFNALFQEGAKPTTAQLAAFGNDPYANKFQQGVVADMLGNRINPKKNLIAVGKRLYDADAGAWVDSGPQGAAAPADIDDVVKLRNDWQNSAGIKAYNNIAPSVASVYKSLNDESPAADNDVLYAAAKIFDPMTGVREGERASILSGMTPGQYLEMLGRRVAAGKGIPLEVKQQIYTVIRRRAGEVYGQAQAEAQNFYEIGPMLGVGRQYMPPLLELPPELGPAQDFTVE